MHPCMPVNPSAVPYTSCRSELSAAQRAKHAAHLRPRLEDGGEEVAVAVLVLAPVLEVLEQRVQLIVGVALQVAVDADIAPVADLRGQQSLV